MFEETGVNPQEGAVSPTAEENITKIVAARLSAEREKLAKAMGYSSWQNAMDSGVDKQLLDAGIDPEVGRPVINSAVDNHPDVVRARQVVAEANAAREAAEITALNAKYGLNIPSVDALDDGVKQLMAKGVNLTQAYVAVHYDEMQNTQAKPAVPQNPLQHVTPLPGNNTPAPANAGISAVDIANAKRYMPGASDDAVKAFLAAHPELK